MEPMVSGLASGGSTSWRQITGGIYDTIGMEVGWVKPRPEKDKALKFGDG